MKTPNGLELTLLLSQFLKMSKEDRVYVFHRLKNKIPGLDKVYRAAENIEFFKCINASSSLSASELDPELQDFCLSKFPIRTRKRPCLPDLRRHRRHETLDPEDL